MRTDRYPTDPPPTFLAMPKSYYDMTPEDQEAVLEEMVEIMMSEQIGTDSDDTI